MNHAVHYEKWKGWRTYAVGGVKDADTEDQLRAVKSFRDAAGYPPRGPRLHLFGVGANLDFIRAIRNDPLLVQSADIATLDRAIAAGRLSDKYWKHPPKGTFSIAEGRNTSTVHGQAIQFALSHLAYMMGPDMDDEEISELLDPKDGRVQSGMGEWVTRG